MRGHTRSCIGVLGLLLMAVTNAVTAQAFPARPIRIVLPVAPGGGVDVIMRPLAQKLSIALGQQVVLDHRGGAGGNIAAELVAAAAPDGYTLLVVTPTISTNVALYKNLRYDPIRDFAAITQLTGQSYVLVVNPAVPAKNIDDFIRLSRSRKGGLAYASSGAGSLQHLGMELFKTQGKFDSTHVPYKGAGPALIDVVGGQVAVMFASMGAGVPFAKSGRLRAIAVSSLKRSPLLPEVATIAESGFQGFEVSGWYGLLAPAATPAGVIRTLNNETVKILKLPDTAERLASDGAIPVPGPPAEFSAYMKSEVAKWARVIRQSGATVD